MGFWPALVMPVYVRLRASGWMFVGFVWNGHHNQQINRFRCITDPNRLKVTARSSAWNSFSWIASFVDLALALLMVSRTSPSFRVHEVLLVPFHLSHDILSVLSFRSGCFCSSRYIQFCFVLNCSFVVYFLLCFSILFYSSTFCSLFVRFLSFVIYFLLLFSPITFF